LVFLNGRNWVDCGQSPIPAYLDCYCRMWRDKNEYLRSWEE
jgi:hypothetical protein